MEPPAAPKIVAGPAGALDPSSQAELDRVMDRLGKPDYRLDTQMRPHHLRAKRQAAVATIALASLAVLILIGAYLT